MPKYLDQAGLTYLWGKLKTKFASLDSNGKVPTSQLPDGLPATIADGSVTEAKLATAVQTKLNNVVSYTEHTVSVTYAAGTVGTRGQVTNLNVSSSRISDYEWVGYTVQNGSSNSVRIDVINAPDSGGTPRIYLAAYRASSGAVSNVSIKVRLAWIPK